MQRASVICLDSEDDDDDVCIVGPPKVTAFIELEDSPTTKNGTDPLLVPSTSSRSSSATSTTTPIKRVQPQLVSRHILAKKRPFGATPEVVRKKSKNGSFKRNRLIKLSDGLGLSDNEEEEEGETANDDKSSIPLVYNNTNVETQPAAEDRSTTNVRKGKFTKEFRKLIQTCRTVDPSEDMEKLIRKKLIGYYLDASDFVSSKSFCALVASVTEEIRKGPHLIYLKIARIIEELKPRRRSIVKAENPPSTSKEGPTKEAAAIPPEEGNSRKDQQIRKLNQALVKLKKRIDELDKEEVDFDEDINSAHMKVERYKKRACQIYEKICDISGESKHAQRSIRKPIKFNGTAYPEFNKTLQAFVNRTNIFPDYFDVKKCLEHCNKQYDMKLRPEEIKALAQDAFVKVGKILQKRRKLDLYEMVSYFVGTDRDPADEDRDLQEKLGHNKQYHAKISDLIDKYAENDPKESIANVGGDPIGEDVKLEPESPDLDLAEAGSSSNHVNNSTAEAETVVAGPEDETMIVKEEMDIDIIDSAPLMNGHFQSNDDDEANEVLIPNTEDMNDAIEYIVQNNLDPFDAVPEVNSMLMGTDDGFNFDL